MKSISVTVFHATYRVWRTENLVNASTDPIEMAKEDIMYHTAEYHKRGNLNCHFQSLFCDDSIVVSYYVNVSWHFYLLGQVTFSLT